MNFRTLNTAAITIGLGAALLGSTVGAKAGDYWTSGIWDESSESHAQGAERALRQGDRDRALDEFQRSRSDHESAEIGRAFEGSQLSTDY
jgi:hypothetical protein